MTDTMNKIITKKQTVKFMLDCSKAVEDNILDPHDMEKYFHDRIKVDGKTNNLGSKVEILRDRSKISVVAETPFSKRYIKYLAKRYLKKQQVRDFLRVVATNRNNYELRYLNLVNGDDADK
ncbi:60S ribosomal protein L22 2-like [Hylaeus volcanicus]|uniref:60S ribosomal protein L22 2-like n=1 Tax=Hylaeus volcanicus TaxID=313075 RepID=UPI0023B7DCFC|nr:60S ribosomal protein L22 2-like [Hylaeus volcanicus]